MRHLLVSALFGLSAVLAHAAPAKDATIEKVLKLSNADAMIDSVANQIEPMMQRQMTMALGERVDQAVVDRLARDMQAVFREEFSWDKFKPVIMRIYRDTFTEEELQGLAGFLESPAGQAYVAKMPQAINASMKASQDLVSAAMPRIQQTVETAIEEALQ
ncbi:DUF2059 domain-containing protein [Chitinibacteraceae bacterium HSL-7]